ncbi:MAG: DUF4058 family protein [Isosphaeraceae bacterium]
MRPPFPGMDPWLEHPAIWLDVHNSLITAIRDDLVPRIAPKYYAGIEQRVYALEPGELVLVGRPDIAVGRSAAVDAPSEPDEAEEAAAVGVLDVEVSINDRLEEWFLEIHDVDTGTLVTALEILSPFNKCHARGRQEYIEKRQWVLRSQTNLVEIDLLRAGEPMPLRRKTVRTDYRILVSRGATRPRAKLFTFNVRQPIPAIPIPLLPQDVEPELDLGALLHALYNRARFDLRLSYSKPPIPPLSKAKMDWARTIIESGRSG